MNTRSARLAERLEANARALAGVTWQAVHDINAAHAKDQHDVSKDTALAALMQNSAAAAAAIRAMTDAQLDAAVPQSLYADTVLTCQFFLEDHPVRHSAHHHARIRAALKA